MKLRQRLLGGVILLSSLIGIQQVQAEQVDLLRSVPLEISGYAVSKEFPVNFATADQALKAIDSSPVLIIHMEVLRRSYQDLPAAEKTKLLAALLKRHQANEKDLQIGFDYGYAQLVLENNKTGLFFLRKANDKIQTQFSSLAYGMAEVEADLIYEASTPETMTTRKMDAMYKLADAVQFDAANHQPGFWPSYMRVVEKIRPLPVYQSFSNRDFTLTYYPHGNNVIPMGQATLVSFPLKATPETLASNALYTSCNPSSSDYKSTVPVSDEKPVASSNVTMNGNGEVAVLQFFSTEKPGLYRVRVTGPYGQPMLSFETYSNNRIVEDLEGDGSFEIVARQYKQDPYNPVLVYRYTPCGFELDKKAFNNFH